LSAAEAVETRWWHSAACRGRSQLFFATDPFSERLATEICRRCVVRQQCEADVRDTEVPGQRYGVVAGLTPDQRRVAWRSSPPT
jgi:predicted RecB family nuclease